MRVLIAFVLGYLLGIHLQSWATITHDNNMIRRFENLKRSSELDAV